MSSFQLFQETRDNLYKVLDKLRDIAEKREDTVLTDELRTFAENVRQKNAFQLAVVGDFNVGKTTIINALLGKEILPVSYLPTTAAITILRFDKTERFRVTYQPKYPSKYPTFTQESTHLLQDVTKYISDAAQLKEPGVSTSKGKEVLLAEKIEQVEVWCNADFLNNSKIDIDIEIIDTPGLGSVFQAHDKVTNSSIRQVDATLFVFSHDGISGANIDFLNSLGESVNQMLFVMTKIDELPNKEQLKDKLDYNQQILKTQFGNINIQEIYPVSANNALEKLEEESGFPEFKQALERFLIKSSGIARLKIPLQIADNNLNTLLRNVERDIKLANTSLKKIQDEKEELERKKRNISERKEYLIRYVDETFRDMVDQAMHDIDSLPDKIKKAVEIQINTYGLKDFWQLDKQIIYIFKKEIDEWITTEEKRLQKRVESLYRSIEHDLREILGMIVDRSKSTSLNKPTDAIFPQVKGVFNKAILQLLQSTAAKTGMTFLRSFNFSLLLYAPGFVCLEDNSGDDDSNIHETAVSVMLSTMIITILLTTLRTVMQEAGSFNNKLGINIKQVLTEHMPNNSVNVYRAIVDGYIDEKGNHKEGMRQKIEKSFTAWQDRLKKDIESVITYNVKIYNESLEKSIREKVGKESKPQDNIKIYNQQKKDLLETEKELIRLKTTIDNLSEDYAIKNLETE